MFNLDDYEPVDERIVKFWAKYAEGKIEGKIEVAKKMLEEKFPLEIISKCSGLSIEEINALL